MSFKIKEQSANDLFEVVNELEELLTERISDLHNVKGGMQSRHAYLYYRKLVWKAKSLMINGIKNK